MTLTFLFIIFGITLFLGFPIAFSMGISGVLTVIFTMPGSELSIPARIFSGMDSFPLMAIPYFILAGKLMESGGVSRRLIDLAEILVGFLKGGLAMVSVVASMIFASISGSAAAGTSAIGSILIPPMVQKGYEKGWVSCLMACGGTIGPVIPPSLLVIVYSSCTGLSVGALFMGGLVPGLLMGGCLMVICYLYGKKHPELNDVAERKTKAEMIAVLSEAAIAIVMPIIIIGGIITGIFTATEAAAVAVVYALIVGVFVFREVKLTDCWFILSKAAVEASKLMLIVGTATFMGWILGKIRFPTIAVNFLTSFSQNPVVILLLVIALLIIIGFFMETNAALIIMVPVLHPLTAQFGFNEYHFAWIVIITMLVGAVTPPVGILLYLSSAMTGISFGESLKFVTPFICSLMVALLLITFVPDLVLFLPNLIFAG